MMFILRCLICLLQPESVLAIGWMDAGCWMDATRNDVGVKIQSKKIGQVHYRIVSNQIDRSHLLTKYGRVHM